MQDIAVRCVRNAYFVWNTTEPNAATNVQGGSYLKVRQRLGVAQCSPCLEVIDHNVHI
jgi:hypothetical protein